ncbi:MAG: A/G-specific adenine glycosylase [Gammaproteobacteria bacterium]|nr:A/G-specific adenine glycosylase [Gammaproteobacteria bacterium]
MQSFTQKLLAWYKKNGRTDLPWQKNKTAYRVWVSEIMLQQTQVKTAIPYYLRFMENFPNIETLAKASLDSILACWAGLGYYSRARNLHKTAVIIQTEYNGKFPSDVNQMIALPGIGRSTASAILAFSEKQALTILDGNVKRVLARLHAVAGWPSKPNVEKQLWQIAETYTPTSRYIVDYTQAIMDLGATVCTRSSPKCSECPVSDECAAFIKNETALYPNKSPKKALPTKRTFFLLLKNQKGEILLEKRPETGIWGGLWSLPETTSPDLPFQCLTHYGIITKNKTQILEPIKHTFSHFKLIATPVEHLVKSTNARAMSNTSIVWHNPIHPLPKGVPAPIKKLLLHLARESL